MTAHLVSRQIYAGSGRVGLGEHSEEAGFQLSQRADYIHMRVGLQTTFDRPIINTRDESHSTARYRRLHVIVGDANRMDVPQLLKLGTTSILLWLLEHAGEAGIDFDALMGGLALADPVGALHTVLPRPDMRRPVGAGIGGDDRRVEYAGASARRGVRARRHGVRHRQPWGAVVAGRIDGAGHGDVGAGPGRRGRRAPRR